MELKRYYGWPILCMPSTTTTSTQLIDSNNTISMKSTANNNNDPYTITKLCKRWGHSICSNSTNDCHWILGGYGTNNAYAQQHCTHMHTHNQPLQPLQLPATSIAETPLSPPSVTRKLDTILINYHHHPSATTTSNSTSSITDSSSIRYPKVTTRKQLVGEDSMHACSAMIQLTTNSTTTSTNSATTSTNNNTISTNSTTSTTSQQCSTKQFLVLSGGRTSPNQALPCCRLYDIVTMDNGDNYMVTIDSATTVITTLGDDVPANRWGHTLTLVSTQRNHCTFFLYGNITLIYYHI